MVGVRLKVLACTGGEIVIRLTKVRDWFHEWLVLEFFSPEHVHHVSAIWARKIEQARPIERRWLFFVDFLPGGSRGLCSSSGIWMSGVR